MTSLMQVVYRPDVHPSQSHNPPEFVVLVEEANLKLWKLNPSAVPLIDVLASSKDPVTLFNHGQTGVRFKPSKQELVDHFGSDDPFKAAEFILMHGKLCKPSDMKTSNKDFFSKD